MKTIITAIVLTIVTLGIYIPANADTIESIEAQVNHHLAEAARLEAERYRLIDEAKRHTNEADRFGREADFLLTQSKRYDSDNMLNFASHELEDRYRVSMKTIEHITKKNQNLEQMERHFSEALRQLDLNKLNEAEHHIDEVEHYLNESNRHNAEYIRYFNEIVRIETKARHHTGQSSNPYLTEGHYKSTEAWRNENESNRLRMEALRHQIKSKRHLAEAQRIAEEVMNHEEQIIEYQGVKH